MPGIDPALLQQILQAMSPQGVQAGLQGPPMAQGQAMPGAQPQLPMDLAQAGFQGMPLGQLAQMMPQQAMQASVNPGRAAADEMAAPGMAILGLQGQPADSAHGNAMKHHTARLEWLHKTLADLDKMGI